MNEFYPYNNLLLVYVSECLGHVYLLLCFQGLSELDEL